MRKMYEIRDSLIWFLLAGALFLVINIFVNGCGLCPGRTCSLMGYIHEIEDKAKECDKQKDIERSNYDSLKLQYEANIKKETVVVNTKELEQANLIIHNQRRTIDLKNNDIEILIDKLNGCEENLRFVDKGKVYIVNPNDWLSKIALDYYHDFRLWPFIWWSNKKEIKNPDLIYPGQELLIRTGYSKQQEGAAIRLHNKRYGIK